MHPKHGEIILENNYPGNSVGNKLKVITWNILYGKNLEGIVEFLQKEDPDILLLEEVDWGNERTEKKNIAKEISSFLHMNYVYSPDYKQIWSRKRYLSSTRIQGGGVIGNAILTKSELHNPSVIDLPKTHMYTGFLPSRTTIRRFLAPVEGSSIALGAEITWNNQTIYIYDTHLEISRASMQTRIDQFSAIYEDIGNKNRVILAGDFNTAAHGAFGIYNALENMDAFTKKNILTPEAVYWDANILPGKDLHDPFDREKDWTLKVKKIYKAKLDWLFTRGFTYKSYSTGPLIYSDHKPLIAVIA